jgi:hypothetical protein
MLEASLSADAVTLSSMPVTGSPSRLWKMRSARRVADPNFPVTGTQDPTVRRRRRCAHTIQRAEVLEPEPSRERRRGDAVVRPDPQPLEPVHEPGPVDGAPCVPDVFFRRVLEPVLIVKPVRVPYRRVQPVVSLSATSG